MKPLEPAEEEFNRSDFRICSHGEAMFLLIIFSSDHFAEPYVSRLQLWAQDFGLIVSAVMAFVMAEALMMLILAVSLSAGLWIYCARAAGAALLEPARRSHYRVGLKLHELR